MNKQDFLEWIGDNKGKVLAIVISCFYLLIFLVYGKSFDWVRLLMFLILPLACIFFSEAMGSGTTNLTNLTNIPITKTSPGCFIALLGWVLLLLPLILAIFLPIFYGIPPKERIFY